MGAANGKEPLKLGSRQPSPRRVRSDDVVSGEHKNLLYPGGVARSLVLCLCQPPDASADVPLVEVGRGTVPLGPGNMIVSRWRVGM